MVRSSAVAIVPHKLKPALAGRLKRLCKIHSGCWWARRERGSTRKGASHKPGLKPAWRISVARGASPFGKVGLKSNQSPIWASKPSSIWITSSGNWRRSSPAPCRLRCMSSSVTRVKNLYQEHQPTGTAAPAPSGEPYLLDGRRSWIPCWMAAASR